MMEHLCTACQRLFNELYSTEPGQTWMLTFVCLHNQETDNIIEIPDDTIVDEYITNYGVEVHDCLICLESKACLYCAHCTVHVCSDCIEKWWDSEKERNVPCSCPHCRQKLLGKCFKGCLITGEYNLCCYCDNTTLNEKGVLYTFRPCECDEDALLDQMF